MRNVLLSLILTGLCGCVASGPMRFSGLSAVEIQLPAPVIVAKGVRATHCPKPGEEYGSYEEAINIALALAPSANALVNVEFRRITRGFARLCAEVSGDAVRF
jgi:hypothetical protein